MKRYEHLRAKAKELRSKKHSLDEIASFLSLSRTTIYYWIKDMEEKPVFNPIKNKLALQKAVRTMVNKYKKLRDDAYSEAFNSAKEHLADRKFRDFICLYMAEGTKYNRWCVSFINSDPTLIKLAHDFIPKMSKNKTDYILHLYPDHEEKEEKEFWSNLLGIKPDQIKSKLKPGSNKMKNRNTRLKHGIFIVRTSDTYFMSRINAYIDYIKSEWK